MECEGEFRPDSRAAAVERYRALGPVAQVVTREVARAMEFDADEYERRVTSDVVAAARDALFASLLAVTVGTRAEFEAACDDHPEYEIVERGSPAVDRVAWHVAPAAETVVAASFAEERDAAVATLRRQAFGTVYRDLVE